MQILDHHVTARRIDSHASEAMTKQARIVLDSDMAGRPDAFNPAEMLLASLSACILKVTKRIIPMLEIDQRGLEVSLRGECPSVLFKGNPVHVHLLRPTITVLACFYEATGQAQAPPFNCDAVKASVADAEFDDVVTVTCTNGHALIAGDTYPDHEMMSGFLGTNEHVPVPALNYVSPIALAPVMGSEPHTRDAALSVALIRFPFCADSNPDGTVIADGVLDECNGQSDDVFGYRYQTSQGAPDIIQCLMGEVPDINALPRVKPLVPAEGGRGPEAGRPPQGGAENLIFVQGDDGERTMTYSYEGAGCYIKYAPSEAKTC